MKKIIVLYDAAVYDEADAIRTEIWQENFDGVQLIHIDVEIPGGEMLRLAFTDKEFSRIFGESGELWFMPN